MSLPWKDIFFQFVCPSLGCVMSAAMYAAPVNDLRKALHKGKLGSLNPVPWAVMTGNCLGWTAYAYYTTDPFILASNIPGLTLSLWLNMGAAKLQYYQLQNKRSSEENENNTLRPEDDGRSQSAPEIGQGGSIGNATEDTDQDELLFSSQETIFLRVVMLWFTLLVVVGWVGVIPKMYRSTGIGILANINGVFFFGAPLQTMKEVIATKNSATIHRPTMLMNWLNTSFWTLYGLAKLDPVIFVPNMIGLFLGILQGVLCILYPFHPGGMIQESIQDVDQRPLLEHGDDAEPQGNGAGGDDVDGGNNPSNASQEVREAPISNSETTVVTPEIVLV